MGAFNEVIDAINGTCPSCSAEVTRPVQYAFGDTWQRRYRIGDRIAWGGNDIGEAGMARVVADGYGTACPACGSDDGAESRYEVFFANDVIVAVKPFSGSFDFVTNHSTFLVLER